MRALQTETVKGPGGPTLGRIKRSKLHIIISFLVIEILVLMLTSAIRIVMLSVSISLEAYFRLNRGGSASPVCPVSLS